jgi:hypothetical protein
MISPLLEPALSSIGTTGSAAAAVVAIKLNTHTAVIRIIFPLI